jgi:immune inhibitor A
MDTSKIEYFHELFFNKGKFQTTYGGTTYQADSVSDYYTEVSGGLISFTGQVVGPYTLDHPVEWYANGYYGGGAGTNTDKVKEHDDWGDIQQMGNDVLDKVIAAKEVDLKVYDNKDRFHDYVDAFIIVHAGMGGEEPGANPETDLWSCKWNIPVEREVVTTSNQTVNVYPFLTVPETALLGVCCHEIGHLIFGWPDFYDTTSSSGPGLGSWCLMSGGNWNGSPAGLSPSHPSAWCKVNAGWVKPAQPKTNSIASVNANVIKTTGVCSLGNIEKVWTHGDTTSSEYFLLENRQNVGFDSALPGTGLLSKSFHLSSPIALTMLI